MSNAVVANPDDAAARGQFHLGHRRSLDGIRGLAIGLVLLDHGMIIGDGFGFIGVNTFFVLSGFLITSLLIEEWDAHKRVSLQRFYARRALRLLPAFVVMLGAFALFAFLTHPHRRAMQEMFEAMRAFFYFTNWARIYDIGHNLWLTHVWSLSIEEQFYLLWPALLIFLLSRNRRSSLLSWIGLGIFLSVTFRIAIYVAGIDSYDGRLIPGVLDRLTMGLDTRADALLSGCFVGVAVSFKLLPKNRRFRNALGVSLVGSVLALVILGICRMAAPWMVIIGWLVASASAAVIILYLVCAPQGVAHRFFESSGFVWLGKISYGLYIWHFPILKALQQHHLPWKHLAYLGPVFVIAIASYYVIERPCLRVKKRYAMAG
jgi:peptidoglycan/LPS O-acetylase OafA/YrhL